MNLIKKIFGIAMIVLSLVSIYPKKVHADFGAGWVMIAKEYGLDGLAWYAGNQVVKHISAQTVNWINSGFKGNPAYVTDPAQFFLDTADRVASHELSLNSPINNALCLPFKAQVRLALVKNYLSENEIFTCSLSKIKNNFDEYIQDFSVGGWDSWFEMTQNNQNNPYGAYLDAKDRLSIQIGNQKNKYQNQLNWGQGFLSFEKCPAGQEVPPALAAVEGDCMVTKQTVTPGSVIEAQLNDSLGSGLKRIIQSDEIDEIIGSLLGQLLNKAVGSVGGLLGTSQPDTNGRTFTTDLVNDTSDHPPDRSQTDCTTSPDTVDAFGNVIPGITTCTTPPPPVPDGTVICTPDANGVLTCTSGNGGPTGGGPGECTPPPTATETQRTQAALDLMIPLLNAIPPMTPIVSPPPIGYQNAVQAIVDQNNSTTGNEEATYSAYVNDNVIALHFAYIVGPADHVVSNIVGMGTTWRPAWRVTSTTCGTGGGDGDIPLGSLPIPGNDTRALFNSLVAGLPFGQQTLLDIAPTLAQYGIPLTPPNAVGDRTKIGDPISRRWTRVGFGEGVWVWVVQSDVYTPNGGGGTGGTGGGGGGGGGVPPGGNPTGNADLATVSGGKTGISTNGVVPITGGNGNNFCRASVVQNAIIRGTEISGGQNGGTLDSCLTYCKAQNASACNYAVDPGNTNITYCRGITGGNLSVQNPYYNWGYFLPQVATCTP